MLGWSRVPQRLPVSHFLSQQLTVNGDGTGTFNMNGNYSVTPEEFYIQAPAGLKYCVCDLMLLLDDNAAFRSNGFAGIATPLANGFALNVYDASSNLIKTFTPVPIKSTIGLSRVFHELDYFVFSGSGDNYIAAALNFPHDHGNLLCLPPGWRFGTTISDDLSTLVEFSLLVQGFIESAL